MALKGTEALQALDEFLGTSTLRTLTEDVVRRHYPKLTDEQVRECAELLLTPRPIGERATNDERSEHG